MMNDGFVVINCLLYMHMQYTITYVGFDDRDNEVETTEDLYTAPEECYAACGVGCICTYDE